MGKDVLLSGCQILSRGWGEIGESIYSWHGPAYQRMADIGRGLGPPRVVEMEPFLPV